jgi:small subunit ribosomal protein S9
MNKSNPEVVKMKGEYMFAIGKRKTSIASVRLYKGTGIIVVNDKPVKEFTKNKYLLDTILSPLVLTDARTKVDCTVHVSGGGITSQTEAVRHGISKALVKHDLLLRSTLKKAGFLTRDSRVKERKKPGLKRARRAPQWAKR